MKQAAIAVLNNHTDSWLLQENKALVFSFVACHEFILLAGICIGVGEPETV